MASVNGTQLTPEDICGTLISIENEYQTHLFHSSQGKSILDDVEVLAIIVFMYTTVIMFPEFDFSACLDRLAKTKTAQQTTLLYMVLEFRHNSLSGGGISNTILFNMLKGSEGGLATISLMAEQLDGMKNALPTGRKTPPGANYGGGKKKQKGGYFTDQTKRAIANILMAGMIVGGIVALKRGAILKISKQIVTYFAGAFQNADHCKGNLAYGWNKISQYATWTSGIQPSCDQIIAANNATADWIVQQTIAVMTTIKPLMLGGATGILLGWSTVQGTIIKYIINPADGLVDLFLAKMLGVNLDRNVTLMNNFKNTTIIAKALETYELMKNKALLSSASQGEKAAFDTLRNQAAGNAERQKLCFNQDTSLEAIKKKTAEELLAMAKSLNITAINPNVQDAKPCDNNTQLIQVEVDLFYKTINDIAKEEGVRLPPAPTPAPQAQQQQTVGVSGMGISPPQPATTATTATTATKADAGGRKKKRKTMKKKHHKKRGRKTGKKKMHKKRKKHTHKHKKHHKNKKRGRKTGKKKH